LVSMIVLSIGSITAQDVITVEPGFNTLLDAFVANPGATLLLQRGGSYVIDQVLMINEPTIIMGENGPAEEPPAVVSLFADPGLAAGQHFFNAGADLTLKNIGVFGFTYDEQQASWAINVASSGISVLLDSCVFQETDWILNTNAFNGLNIEYRNNQFYNLCHVGWDNWGGYGTLWGGDTIEFKCINNTWVHSGRVLNAAYIGPHALETMDHNTYVNIWGELYYPSISDGFVCTNNIIFNPDVRGFVGKRVVTTAPGDTLWSWPGDFSDFTSSNPRDSLQGDICLYPSLDPQFASGAFPAKFYEIMHKERMERHLPENMQGEGFPYVLAYLPDDYTLADFQWPLPFNLKPTNEDLWEAGSDGYPLGDLRWFGPEVVAAWYAGEPCPQLIPSGIKDVKQDFGLRNYPNPSNSSTIISYTLQKGEKVTLKVYSTVGAEIATLVNSTQNAGSHQVVYNTANLSSGLYFYKLQVGNHSEMQKMMVER
jgi:hypothetical protein